MARCRCRASDRFQAWKDDLATRGSSSDSRRSHTRQPVSGLSSSLAIFWLLQPPNGGSTRRVRDFAGVVRIEGWHAGVDVPGPPPGPAARRQASGAPHGLRRVQHQPDAGVRSVQLRAPRPRRRRSPSPTCAVAANTARRGIEAGMFERKQNVFDDFIAAAEWLCASGYSTPRKLAIEGGSNGGLLTAAVMVQRPDLFGAVLCRVPVADMLRYHLFTVGRFWISEYGSADDPEQFPYLLAYSPYHNVTDGVGVSAYPDHDRGHRRSCLARHGQEVRRAAAGSRSSWRTVVDQSRDQSRARGGQAGVKGDRGRSRPAGVSVQVSRGAMRMRFSFVTRCGLIVTALTLVLPAMPLRAQGSGGKALPDLKTKPERTGVHARPVATMMSSPSWTRRRRHPPPST